MAGQDIKKRIEPGGAIPVSVGGDYLYLKFADREIDVVIDQERVTMQVGDKYRPGRFESFEIHNPDPVNAARVIFTAGEGDYQTQTVKGELNVVPSIITSDGTVKSDDRFYLDIHIDPHNDLSSQATTIFEVIQRTRVKTSDPVGEDIPGFAMRRDSRELVIITTDWSTTSSIQNFERWDLDTWALIESGDTNSYGAGVREIRDFIAVDNDTGLMVDNSGRVYTVNLASMTVDWGNPILNETIRNDGGAGYMGVALSDDRTELVVFFESTAGEITWKRYAFNTTTMTVGALNLQRTFTLSGGNLYAKGSAFIDGRWIGSVQTFDGANFGYQVFDENGDPIEKGDGTNLTEADLDLIKTTNAAVYFEQMNSGRLMAVERYRAGSPSERHVYFANRWERNADIQFRGRATNGPGADLSWIFKPVDPELSQAVVSVSVANDGYKVQGQVILLALELYLAKFIDGNYLDVVYGVEIPDTGEAPQWRKRYSGNESFQRVGYPDQFTTLIPGTVRLYVSQAVYDL